MRKALFLVAVVVTLVVTSASAALACHKPPEDVTVTYAVGASMQRGEPLPATELSCTGAKGDAYQISYTRAPRYLEATVCGQTVRFAASPRNTVMHLNGPGVYVETWSRRAGHEPKTRTIDLTF